MSTPRDTIMIVGDIMSASGVLVHERDTMISVADTMMSVGQYHEYTRVSIQIELFSQWPSPMIPPSVLMISPTVLMISTPRTEHPPVYCTDIMQGDGDSNPDLDSRNLTTGINCMVKR